MRLPGGRELLGDLGRRPQGAAVERTGMYSQRPEGTKEFSAALTKEKERKSRTEKVVV
jgi:hypothetical protein